MFRRPRILERFFGQEDEELGKVWWKDITDVAFEFDTKTVTLTDIYKKKFTVEGIEKLENLAGSEYEVITLRGHSPPGAFMMLLRPSNVRLLDPTTLSIRG